MPNVNDVIKALEFCLMPTTEEELMSDVCSHDDCPYYRAYSGGKCVSAVGRDALALLKEQERDIADMRNDLQDTLAENLCLSDLLKAQEPIEARLHLCESCTKEYPECDATTDGMEFGCGVGNDNIIGCMAYVNRWKVQEPRRMSVEDIKWLENGHVVWIEFSDGRLLPFIVEDGCLMRWGSLWKICEEAFYDEDYEARAWSSRPSDKLRSETPWF